MEYRMPSAQQVPQADRAVSRPVAKSAEFKAPMTMRRSTITKMVQSIKRHAERETQKPDTVAAGIAPGASDRYTTTLRKQYSSRTVSVYTADASSRAASPAPDLLTATVRGEPTLAAVTRPVASDSHTASHSTHKVSCTTFERTFDDNSSHPRKNVDSISLLYEFASVMAAIPSDANLPKDRIAMEYLAQQHAWTEEEYVRFETAYVVFSSVLLGDLNQSQSAVPAPGTASSTSKPSVATVGQFADPASTAALQRIVDRYACDSLPAQWIAYKVPACETLPAVSTGTACVPSQSDMLSSSDSLTLWDEDSNTVDFSDSRMAAKKRSREHEPTLVEPPAKRANLGAVDTYPSMWTPLPMADEEREIASIGVVDDVPLSPLSSELSWQACASNCDRLFMENVSYPFVGTPLPDSGYRV